MMIASLPLDDWQFWVATALMLGAIYAVAKPFIPKRGKKIANCPGCPSGEAANKPPRPKHVDITIGGKRVKP
jgi:hypothetical protein